MREFHDAREVAEMFESTTDVFVHWAPGDATLYRVALLDAVGVGFASALERADDWQALVVTQGASGPGPALVVEGPRRVDGSDLWDAERFGQAYPDHLGWWAGVRPLLAALEWTIPECASTYYDPGDAAAFAEQEVTGG